jgi:hypothetical protein
MQVASIGKEQRDGLRKGAPAMTKAIAQGGQDAHAGRMQGIAGLLRGLGNDPLDVFDLQHEVKFYFYLFKSSSFL